MYLPWEKVERRELDSPNGVIQPAVGHGSRETYARLIGGKIVDGNVYHTVPK